MVPHVQVDAMLKDLDRTKFDLQAAIRQVLGQLAAVAVAQAKATSSFKDRTGNLRSSIQRKVEGPWAVFVKAGGSSARYAKFVEEGTKPHPIVARRARFLVFDQNGQTVFRKRVFHPGTKPARFMQTARDFADAMAVPVVERALNSAIGK